MKLLREAMGRLVDEIYVQAQRDEIVGLLKSWIPLQAVGGQMPNWSGDLSLLPPTDNPILGGRWLYHDWRLREASIDASIK